MTKRGSSRRSVVTQLLLGAALLGCASLFPATAVRAARRKGKGGKAPSAAPSDDGKTLKPGQFTWHPERAPRDGYR